MFYGQWSYDQWSVTNQILFCSELNSDGYTPQYLLWKRAYELVLRHLGQYVPHPKRRQAFGIARTGDNKKYNTIKIY